jgi:hypothetical protein
MTRHSATSRRWLKSSSRRRSAEVWEHERGFGMHPEGVKLSTGLEDWHHLVGNMGLALEMV